MRRQVQFPNIILKSLIQLLNPIESLLVFDLLFGFNVCEYIFYKFGVEEAFLNSFLDIQSTFHVCNQFLKQLEIILLHAYNFIILEAPLFSIFTRSYWNNILRIVIVLYYPGFSQCYGDVLMRILEHKIELFLY